jgi:5-methylcytosine-specific restriction endonuclease McrA
VESRICPECGKEYVANPVRLRHGRQTTCSRECSYRWRYRNVRRRVALTCVGCGAEFWRNPSQFRNKIGAGKFCSRECRDRNRVAELHPQYLGGPEGLRGVNWQAQKRKAKHRDQGVCQECGGRGTDVHHIRPFREFDDHREANDLANLVLLCRPCHRRADAVLQARG